jgi:predicted nuclease with RNAse H fold
MGKGMANCTIGIDVGGPRKGFHIVVFNGTEIMETRHCNCCPQGGGFPCLANIIRTRSAPDSRLTIAIDAPLYLAVGDARSRHCERSLVIGNQKINCFSTPSSIDGPFYAWVRNGRALHGWIESQQFAINCDVIETFPQAVACYLRGEYVSAKRKATVRREILEQFLPKDSMKKLPNIDFLDAALCAVAGYAFSIDKAKKFGREDNPEDRGVIVVPSEDFAAWQRSLAVR